MTQAVGLLDGEVNRNWHLVDSKNQRHVLSLFHDCVTGARAAMLDYEEVPGSAGTTNLFNLVAGQVDLPFGIKDTGERGHLTIRRRGMTGFSYECQLNGRVVLDTTSMVQNTDYEYEVTIPASVDIGNRVSGVTWYEVHTKRKADGKGTLVHRRFRDFYALHEQVESLMKGHHLRSSLPRFPGKKSKLWTNHGDMSFVEERRKSLEQYTKTLLQLPHVSTLDSTCAFLGMVGNLREFSVAWEGKELGATLKRASDVAGGSPSDGGKVSAGDRGAPPVITSVQGGERSPPGVCPGDRLFKVNGESTELMSLEAAWSSVKRASRPVLLHFLGPVIRMDSAVAPLPQAFLRRKDPEQRNGNSSLADDGGPPLAGVLLRPDGAGGGGTSAGSGSQWSLRGMSQTSWATWGRGHSGTGEPSTSTRAASSSGSGNKAPPGRTVGPFGDGAGAAGSLPATSKLFGDGGGAEHSGRELSSQAWRPAAGAGVSGLHRPSGDRAGASGSTRGTSDWMPNMSIESGSSSRSAAATRWGAASALSGGGGGGGALGSSQKNDFHAGGERALEPSTFPGSATSKSTAAPFPSEMSSFGSGTSAWPPERRSAMGSVVPGVGASGERGIGTSTSIDDGGRGGVVGAVFAGGRARGAGVGRKPDVPSGAAPVGLAAGTGGSAGGGIFGAAVAVGEGDEDAEEENPFA